MYLRTQASGGIDPRLVGTPGLEGAQLLYRHQDVVF